MLDHQGQELQKLKLSAEAVAYGIAVAGQHVYITTNDGKLHIFGPAA